MPKKTGMSVEDKRFYLTAGISIFALWWITDALDVSFDLFDEGRTDRVPFDKDRTQQICYSDPKPGDPGHVNCVKQEWEPNALANQLYTSMVGVDMIDETDRLAAWADVAGLGLDRAKWLHNYWLDKIDDEDTLYRWIDGEWRIDLTDDTKDRAMDKLKAAGVGW